MTDELIACDGCGETNPDRRCFGCLHNFGDASSAWVRLKVPEGQSDMGFGPEETAVATRATIEAYAMTDAAIEAVARAFCKRMGLDPYEAMPMETPRWQVYRHSARHHIAMHLAVTEVLK